MIIRLLCVGDVVGSPGRAVLASVLPRLVKDHRIDCTIVNAENMAAGSGLTPHLYKKLLDCGVNLITMGDHIYRKLDILPVLHDHDNIVRPANFPRDAPGRDFALYQTALGPSVAVISVLGRLFMKPPTDCPFRAVDRVLAQLPQEVRMVAVDVHAEATSEKVALGWHLDGRVSVVFGTHTHVPTADEHILNKGTAYITDLGMTGPYDSVLGRSKDRVISAMISSVPTPFEVADGQATLCGAIVAVDSLTGKATSIERVSATA